MSQNLKSPNPNDKEKRLERRWRRREARNDSLKHNRVTSATKTTAKICDNATILTDESDHTIDDDTNDDCEILSGECTGVSDEVEADYESLLAKYNPVIEADSASNHIDGSNIDEVEADYRSLLDKYNPIIETDSAINHSDGSKIFEVVADADADYRSFLHIYESDVEIVGYSERNNSDEVGALS